MKKAQTTLEAMMAVGVILTFVLLLYTFMLYPRIQQSNYAQTYYLAKSTCSDFSNAINTVVYGGNGFNEKIFLPDRLYGTEYKIHISDTLIQLEWGTDGVYSGDVYCQYRADGLSYKVGNNIYNPPIENFPHKTYLLNNSHGVVTIA